jgi:hypothetical protein
MFNPMRYRKYPIKEDASAASQTNLPPNPSKQDTASLLALLTTGSAPSVETKEISPSSSSSSSSSRQPRSNGNNKLFEQQRKDQQQKQEMQRVIQQQQQRERQQWRLEVQQLKLQEQQRLRKLQQQEKSPIFFSSIKDFIIFTISFVDSFLH